MTFRRTAMHCLISGIVFMGGGAAEADLRPPVKIKMAADSKAAISGQEYTGVFEVQVGAEGSVDHVELIGEGWTTTGLEAPAVGTRTGPGVIRVPFRAMPQDAEKPVGLSVTWNGRRVTKRFRVGEAAMAQSGKPYPAIRLDADTGPAVAEQVLPPGPDANAGRAGSGACGSGAYSLRVTGRIVYTRSDGQVHGVDAIWVQVMDENVVSDNCIWEGLTNMDGTFDTGWVTADDPDGPDVYIRWECDTGVVNVQDGFDIGEEDYSWSTLEMPGGHHEDFGGGLLEYGTLTSADSSLMPAMHIHNTIVRAYRYLLNRTGLSVPELDVQWPEDSTSYSCSWEEIYVANANRWQEDVLNHEYGHHFECIFGNIDDPTYCNGVCDPNPAEDDCTHCLWCDENLSDAWQEGFADWLEEWIPGSFSQDYQGPGGGPYQPILRGANFETPLMCNCADSGLACPYPNPVFTTAEFTEGFVAALLRDIADNSQDDHDGDGILDLLCLGPEEILYIVNTFDPDTVFQFLDAFRAQYPQHTARLWSTAFNVDPAFVAGFPADSEPPGVVPFCASSTHPQGIGGSLPCMTIEFDAAPDDATGACRYSVVATQNPAGADPGEVESQVSGTNGCRLATVVPTPALGSWYVSIKARDNAGNWSDDWATFGPFEVLDCNNTGFLDVCDIDCNSEGIPGCLVGGLCLSAQGSCGTSPDCNTNSIPDECDLAEGTSEDCNRDGTPDECQGAIIKHFTGTNTDEFGVSQWELTENWQEGALPVDGDHVCIPLGTPATDVSFSEDVRRLTTLNCETDFSIDGSSAELRIDQPSYVSGDLDLMVTSTLRAMTSLDVGGELRWQGLEILGPGTVNVFGGFDLSSPVARPQLRSGAHLSILDGAVNIHGDEYLDLNDTSTFSIGLPVTYSYDGNFNIFTGAPTTIVNVAGSLIRNSGTLNATLGSFVLNSGLIRNRTGDLTFSYGGTHGGSVLGDTGTLLRLNGTHDFLATSSLAGDDVTFGGGGASFVRGGVNIADALVISGATCTFTSDADVTSYGQHLIVLAGSARLESPVTGAPVTIDTVTIGDLTTEGSKDARFNTGQPVSFNTLNLIKGDIHGADPITINDSFVWGTGGGQIAAGGAITCNAPATIQGGSSSRSLNRAFNNAAYATFLGAFIGSGPFNNLASGTVELKGNSTGIAAGTTTNAGLVVKTQGTGSASSLNGLNNSGQVRAEVGEISFSGGGTNSGAILGLPGTLLSFINGTHEMTPASSLTADDIRFANFTANIRGDVDITDTLTMDGGTCTFTNEANVTSYGQHLAVLEGTAEFNAPGAGPALEFDTVTIGQQTSGGKVARFNTGQPVGINALNLVKGNIEGADAITINDSFIWGTGGGSINAGGAITCNGPVTIQGNASARNLLRAFNNAGYATFFGGFTASGAGSFNNLATGTIDLRNTGAAFGLSTTPTLSNHGLLVRSAGAGVSSIANHFRNTGTVEVQIGTLEFYGGNGLTHIQTAGETILNGGSLSVTLGAPYQIQGGDLTGSGAITAAVQNSSGTVKPGLSAGQINITGNYTQGALAALEIELGGPVPGVSHDRLAVSGSASLAGTLRVALIGGYIPAIGEQFVILTAGTRTGTFAAVEPLVPGLAVEAIYGPTTVTIEVTGLGAPAASITGVVSRKANSGGPGGVCDLQLIPEVKAEPRQDGVSELRIAFDLTPGAPGMDPVTIEEKTCPAPGSYVPYTGSAAVSASVAGNELVLAFSPALENLRTYRITMNPNVTSLPGQSVEVRALVGDIDGNGLVNAVDRALVVGAWTSPSGFTCASDLDSSGRTNAVDRALVVGAWTGPQNCAP